MLVAFIPLTTYTLLILFRNIVAGFQAVPSEVLEAADGMGYTPRERLLRVELPLAVPLMSRASGSAAVTLIGLATVARSSGTVRRARPAHHRRPPDVLPDEVRARRASCRCCWRSSSTSLLVRVERIATPWSRSRAGTVVIR